MARWSTLDVSFVDVQRVRGHAEIVCHISVIPENVYSVDAMSCP